MKLISCMRTGVLLSTLVSFNAYAWDVVGTTKLTYVENAWSGNGLAIHAEDGISGCSADDTEFAIDSAHPAYDELVAMVLAAFTAQTDVQIVVDTGVCLLGNRTKVIAVRLRR